MTERVPAAIARWLLVAALLGLGLAVVFGVGWYRSVRRAPTPLEAMSAAERQALVAAVLAQSPGVFSPALFDPRVGYTLKTGTEIEAWDDIFTSNRLGYRTGVPEKRSGVFRVVFVGDSWTFGLGVSEAESFPKRFEELALRRSGRQTDIEAWTLALPGYNTLNEIAALENLAAVLEPDAVVFCPTINDIDSSHMVLPNGSLARGLSVFDDFGSAVSVSFKNQPLDSHLFLQRWTRAMREVSTLQSRLAGREVPSMVFFTGKWDDRLAHSLVLRGKIRSSYVITPEELTTLEWRNPPPFYHPNPEAHDLYSRMVYQGLEAELGWNPLPGELRAQVRIFEGGETAPDWIRKASEYLRAESRKRIDVDFHPSADRAHQSGGGIDPRTGALERAAVLFVRREAGVERLSITLRRTEKPTVFDPEGLRVSIPSASGGTSVAFAFDDHGPPDQSLVLDLPSDIEVGSVIDVIIEADWASVQPGLTGATSFVLVAVEQE